MNHSVYPIRRVGKKMAFIFKSNNSHGTNPVKKAVVYTKIMRHGKRYYNLEFGDFAYHNHEIDDRVVTDNGDMRKVLRTVVTTLDVFFHEFPKERVHIDGSDSIRHAYYHKLIRDYEKLIVTHYDIHGYRKNRIERFKNDVEYDFIVVNKK